MLFVAESVEFLDQGSHQDHHRRNDQPDDREHADGAGALNGRCTGVSDAVQHEAEDAASKGAADGQADNALRPDQTNRQW